MLNNFRKLKINLIYFTWEPSSLRFKNINNFYFAYWNSVFYEKTKIIFLISFQCTHVLHKNATLYK